MKCLQDQLVLVTGGAGFIGRHVVRSLCAAGVRVRVLDDLSVGSASALPPEVHLQVGDVRDAQAVSLALRDVDLVVHLAARVTIRGSVEAAQGDLDVNLGGTVTLLQALAGTRVRRVVNASSMAVYADAEPGCLVTEAHPTVPISPYGASKLAAEHYTRLLAGLAGKEYVNLRFFNTYGPGQAVSPYVGVVTIFVHALLAGQAPTILGDGLQQRDFIAVEDVAAAVVASLHRPVAGQTLNIGTGRATTVLDLARHLQDALGSSGALRYLPARAEELRCSVADATRARTLLDWQPRAGLNFASVIGDLRARSAAAPVDAPHLPR